MGGGCHPEEAQHTTRQSTSSTRGVSRTLARLSGMGSHMGAAGASHEGAACGGGVRAVASHSREKELRMPDVCRATQRQTILAVATGTTSSTAAARGERKERLWRCRIARCCSPLPLRSSPGCSSRFYSHPHATRIPQAHEQGAASSLRHPHPGVAQDRQAYASGPRSGVCPSCSWTQQWRNRARHGLVITPAHNTHEQANGTMNTQLSVRSRAPCASIHAFQALQLTQHIRRDPKSLGVAQKQAAGAG